MVRRFHTPFFRSHALYILIWEVNGSFWATVGTWKVENVCLGKRLGGQVIILVPESPGTLADNSQFCSNQILSMSVWSLLSCEQ
jgi:hypothetical protein